MIETWKQYLSSRYEVSNIGRVRSNVKKGSVKILSPWKTRLGYEVATLWMNGKPVDKQVSHLVAECFISSRPENFVVNHIDFNVQNNCVDNLEWVSQGDNVRHSARAGRMDRAESPWLYKRRGEGHPLHKLTIDDVKNIRNRRSFGEKMSSIAIDYPQVSPRQVRKICKGDRWKITA